MIQSLTDLVTHNVALAYALIFLTSFGEALFVVGIFVPSTVILLAAGLLQEGASSPFGRLWCWQARAPPSATLSRSTSDTATTGHSSPLAVLSISVPA